MVNTITVAQLATRAAILRQDVTEIVASLPVKAQDHAIEAITSLRLSTYWLNDVHAQLETLDSLAEDTK